MATTTKANQNGTFRIHIHQREIDKWLPADTPQSLLKYWIDLGRERDQAIRKMAEMAQGIEAELVNLRQSIHELRDQCERQAHLLVQATKLLAVATTPAHYQMEVIQFNSQHKELNHDERNQLALLKIKEANFDRYLKKHFPGIPSDSLLRTEIEERAPNA